MTLFSKWKGKITLQPIILDQSRIGKNYIYNYALGKVVISGEIFDSHYQGYDLLKTNLDFPYSEILIRKKGSTKNAPKNRLWLTTKGTYDLKKLNESEVFEWENISPVKNNYTPEQIQEDWKGKFKFKKEQPELGEAGLRAPQIGALHAISAHFSVGQSFEAATIVLPTGTGKTETMLSALVYLGVPKLLVLVPSNTLRNQILGKFRTLGYLPLLGVVPTNTAKPRVACIKKGINTRDEAKKILENSNVIIATPNILNSSNHDAVMTLTTGCTDLFIDEAHHGTAKTWDSVRQYFKDKRITQFTATPFRNDGKHIGGKIVFNYKLGDAQRDKYYKAIRLKTIEEFGEDYKRDYKIAEKAVEILKKDIESGYDHLLLARVKTTKRADNLVKIYEELAAEYKPKAVHNKRTKVQNTKNLNDLTTGKSRIIVCVDMLGEGFDLPNLKIAAIHDSHQSLAITLQFIGRFTRTAENLGDAAAVINIADPKSERDVQKLYAEGADWDALIERMSEDRIENEMRLEAVVESLKEKGDLHDQISLWNLNPLLTTQIYRTENTEWYPEKYVEALPANMEHWHSVSLSKNILVVLGISEVPVKWGSHQDLNDLSNKLLIAYWNREENVLFVYCNDYNGLRVSKIVDEITNDSAKLLHGSAVFNILNNVELPLVKNLGTSKVGAISFTSYFGPNVTEGLAEIDKSTSELNNIACLGYEDGERVIWAATQKKGKVWAARSGTISEWITWCHKIWDKVTDETPDLANITKSFLKPEVMTSYHTAAVIGVQWGEIVQSKMSDKVDVYFGQKAYPLYMVGIDAENVGGTNSILISFQTEETKSVYSLIIDPIKNKGYEYQLKSGPQVAFQFGNKPSRPLEEIAVEDPFIVRYADGTYSYNCYHIPADLEAGSTSKDIIEVWSWNGIPLNKESMGKDKEVKTIQYKTFKEIESEYDFIFNDDGPGEAADLVALKEVDDNNILLCLIHCKNAIGSKPSGSIDNLYTLCGQAQKSIKTKHAGLYKLEVDLRRRQEKWSKNGHTRLLKGDFKTLSYFRNKVRKAKLSFKVIIVQPGLSKAAASQDILKLLATTELYLKKTTEAEFKVIGSA